MADYIPDGILSMTSGAADRLLQKGDGDAALLYLHLLRRGSFPVGKWPEARLASARSVLAELGLVTKEAETAPLSAPEQDGEALPPDYTADDLKQELESGGTFPHLAAEVERRLGRKLSVTDLKALLTVYDHLALPAEVVLLLVNWCVEETERKYGAGRKPRMSQIRKEAFLWRRLGVDTAEAADSYVRRRSEMNTRQKELFRLLDLPPRPPVEKEQTYMEAWDSMGFEDAAIRLAYEKTVLKKQTLNWAYMNSILKNWHAKGLHTVAAIQAGDAPRRSTGGAAGMTPGQAPRPEQDERAKASMERLRRRMRQEQD